MALQIKQIIPCDAVIYYTKDWVNDPTSQEYQEVKSKTTEELLRSPPFFYFSISDCLGLALVERGAVQFVTPLDFSEEEGKILPIDPEKQEDYVCVTGNVSPNLDPFKLEIINRIKASNE